MRAIPDQAIKDGAPLGLARPTTTGLCPRFSDRRCLAASSGHEYVLGAMAVLPVRS
jgi:hypothetical protein